MRTPDGAIFQLETPPNQQIVAEGQTTTATAHTSAAKTQKRSAQKPKLSEETVTPVSDQALAEVYDAVMRHRITDLTTIQRIIHQLKQWRLILNAASKWTSMQSRARTCCAITSITFSSASKRTSGSSGAAQPILSRMFYP